MSDLSEVRRLRAELESIGRLMDGLPLGTLKALVDGQVDLQVQVDGLVAFANGGPVPRLTPGAQAILTKERNQQ